MALRTKLDELGEMEGIPHAEKGQLISIKCGINLTNRSRGIS